MSVFAKFPALNLLPEGNYNTLVLTATVDGTAPLKGVYTVDSVPKLIDARGPIWNEVRHYPGDVPPASLYVKTDFEKVVTCKILVNGDVKSSMSEPHAARCKYKL